jgi:beta-glucosidase
MKFGQFSFVLLCMLTSSVAAQLPAYKNPEIPLENRITDLLSRLTPEEKVSQLLYNSPAIERLDIQEYNWWNECLHGVARAGKATVFPQAIGMAATFDDDLIYRMADAISTEARAKYNLASSNGNRGQYMGLTFWTPNINIFRDPRWGRGQETYGEDPFLTGILGAAFVKGLQGNDPQYLKAAACAKHFAVHSGPEKTRHEFNAEPSETDFRETYLPAFRALSDAGVESVMCAYNRLYDEPCCGSSFLLNDILRKEFGFKGHIVTDCWALDDIWLRHKVVPTREEAAAMAAKAGVNLNCGYIYSYLPGAIKQGLIKESILDSVLTPLLRTRFKLGMFDPLENNPFAIISADTVNCEKYRALAYEAASKSIVLLQNKNNVLPLKRDSIRNILIAGPVSADIQAMVGNYNGWSGNIITFLEGITEAAGPGITVDQTPGCLLNTTGSYTGFWQAEMADVVIVCLGNTKLLEGEDGDAMLNSNGGDRIDLKLPLSQREYINELRKKLPGKRIVAVITGGSAIALQEVLEAADAVLFAWYPGEQGGKALADILFGDVNPSGSCR